jgi:hypothetical protein
MLKLQNGNTGFGHTIPLLALVTADLGAFFDSSERIEPALDGGLFLMSFLLALESQGLASCCLNFCVGPQTDKMAHRIGNIPEQEKSSRSWPSAIAVMAPSRRSRHGGRSRTLSAGTERTGRSGPGAPTCRSVDRAKLPAQAAEEQLANAGWEHQVEQRP